MATKTIYGSKMIKFIKNNKTYYREGKPLYKYYFTPEIWEQIKEYMIDYIKWNNNYSPEETLKIIQRLLHSNIENEKYLNLRFKNCIKKENIITEFINTSSYTLKDKQQKLKSYFYKKLYNNELYIQDTQENNKLKIINVINTELNKNPLYGAENYEYFVEYTGCFKQPYYNSFMKENEEFQSFYIHDKDIFTHEYNNKIITQIYSKDRYFTGFKNVLFFSIILNYLSNIYRDYNFKVYSKLDLQTINDQPTVVINKWRNG